MSQKTLKILLVFSLATNLFVVAVIGGFFSSGRHTELRLDHTTSEGVKPIRATLANLKSILRALDKKDRRELGRLVKEAQTKTGGFDPDVQRTLIVSLAKALVKTPFDPEEVLKIIETSFEETSRRLAVSRNIFVEMLATMDPEKRELLAKALQN